MAKGLARFMGAQDMTVGSPVKKLIQFSIPLLIGNLAQQLYNTVDSIVVGRYVGDNALAAVGASGPMINLLLVLFVGISTGANVMVAQYFGAKRRSELSDTVGTVITLTLLASIIIMIVGPLLVPPFLRMVDTPVEIFDMTSTYLTIYFLGIAGMAYYNIIAGVLRGMGDSVMPLLFLMAACLTNIVLDLLFVAKFGWGVAGVAIATIIAQFLSASLCLFRLFQMKDTLDINLHTLKPHLLLAKELLILGLPSGLSQAIFSMSAIVVQSLTNSFGALVVAVNTVVMRVDGFAMMPNFTFGNDHLYRPEYGRWTHRPGGRRHPGWSASGTAGHRRAGGGHCDLWLLSHPVVYRYAGSGGDGPEYAAGAGPGLYCHGHYPDAVRRHAGCG